MRRFSLLAFAIVFAFVPSASDEANSVKHDFWQQRCLGCPITQIAEMNDDRARWLKGTIRLEGSTPVFTIDVPPTVLKKWVWVNFDDNGLTTQEVPLNCTGEACSFKVAMQSFYGERQIQRVWVGYTLREEDKEITWLYLWMPGFQNHINRIVGTN